MAETPPNPAGAFPSTDWSAILKKDGRALDNVLHTYLPALRVHLLARKGVSRDEVDDLLQGFIASKILEADLISTADPARGRFRTLLLTALDRYVVSQHRAEAAQKRGGGHIVNLDEPVIERSARHHPPDHSRVFEVAWARQVISQTLNRMREVCLRNGREQLWGVFDVAILQPALDGAELPPADEIAQRFSFDSVRAVRNAMITARRMFVRLLRQVVSEYAGGKADVEEEIRSLRVTLLNCGAAEDGFLRIP